MTKIPVRILNTDGLITIDCDRDVLGTRWDNNAQTLDFSRPSGFGEYDLVLFFRDRAGGRYEVNIGTANSYTVSNALTQTEDIDLQIAFKYGAEYREGSNSLRFAVRNILKEGGVPEPVPAVVYDTWFPSVNADGTWSARLSASNIPPASVNIRGPKGEKGERGESLFAFSVEGGRLYLHYAEGTTPPDMHISDGHLIYSY